MDQRGTCDRSKSSGNDLRGICDRSKSSGNDLRGERTCRFRVRVRVEIISKLG